MHLTTNCLHENWLRNMRSFSIQSLSKPFVFLLAALLFSFRCVFATYASQCLTADYEAGICIPVKSCAKAYLMIKNLGKGMDAESYNRTVQILRESRCDIENITPHICCPINETQMNPEIYKYLSELQCGDSSRNRIANGERADLFDFRWSALLIYEGRNKFRCAGSLITDRYVLTAAHCCKNSMAPPKAVRLGEYDLSTEVDCITIARRVRCADPPEDINIAETILHPGYYQKHLEHDIALLRLERKVEFKKSIRPICLPISKELQMETSEWYLVAGWGRTENNHSSNSLLYTNIPRRPREFCRQYLRFPNNERLTEGQICAGGERLYDSCKGDSGGPIFNTNFYVDGSARSIQYGVVSVGVSSCGQVTAPAIYTNVSHYMQWITDHLSLK